MAKFNKEYAEKLLNETVYGCTRILNYKQGDLYGVEIENELDEDTIFSRGDVIDLATQGISVKGDGSLRGNAYEFITSPLPIDRLVQDIQLVCKTAAKYDWSFSRRTSTHIHINFSDQKVVDLLKFLTLYWIFEPLLFEVVKPSRYDNTFCAPSLSTRDILIHSVTEGKLFNLFADENVVKYASMNLAPLWRFGTVECRVFHSSFDPEELTFWLKFLDTLKKKSRTFKSLNDIKKKFIDTKADDFALEILGKEHYIKFRRKTIAIADLVREGFRKTSPIYQLDDVLVEAENFLKDLAEKDRKFLQEINNLMNREVDLEDFIDGRAHVEVAGAAPDPDAPVLAEVAGDVDLDWLIENIEEEEEER